MGKVMRFAAVSVLGVWLAVASAQQPAVPDVVDSRVVAALKKARLGYTMDEGDFRLTFTLADGRTQHVWVASKTAKISKLEFRDVWSVAYRGQGQLPANLATRLLTENVRMVMGAWQVNQSQDEYLLVFSYPIAADADADTLQEVVEAVTLSADRMDKELTGKDDF
jgi:hypothetical protein